MRTHRQAGLLIALLIVIAAGSSGFAADGSTSESTRQEEELAVDTEKVRTFVGKLFPGNQGAAFVRGKVEAKWYRIVAEAQKTRTLVTASVLFSVTAPLRHAVLLERMGKPESSTEERMGGVRHSDGSEIQKKTFYWYGPFGIAILEGKPENLLMAIAYDPKRPKP